MAGYSTTPLATKLGVTPGSVLALVDGLGPLELDLPADVIVRRDARRRADVVLAFSTSAAALDRRLEHLGRMIFPAGALWVAWPKRASGVTTDLTDQVVRTHVLPTGLVDNKVCAIDETWSALRFVWRSELRGDPARPARRP